MSLAHAIAHFDVQSAVIVYEDKENPCVDAFIDHLRSISLPFSTQSGSLNDDLLQLLSARILCYGFGTFAEAILCISRHAEIAYAFREVESFPHDNKAPGLGIRELLLKRGLKLHVVRDSARGYIQKHGWLNSPAQRELMLSYSFADDSDPVIGLSPV